MLLLGLLLCPTTPTSALAQEAPPPATRAEALRRQREQKQTQLLPNKPDGLSRGLTYVEENGLFIIARDGFHPKILTLTTGSGYAFGVGYRNRTLFRRNGVLELWTAGSLKQYWAIEGRAMFPFLARGRMMAEGLAFIREYPREDFFGLGPVSRRIDQSSFLLHTGNVSGRVGFRVNPRFMVGAGAGLLTPRTGRGREGRSVEEVFTPSEAPGLGARVNYFVADTFAQFDYREPLNARKGGLYRFDLSRFTDPDDTFTFTRMELDLRQYIGLFAGRRVIALRARTSTSDVPAGSGGQPFFLMPWLGGNDTLRGFRNYRFRGPHALLLQAEYRWEIWAGLEAALFYDAGKVALQRRNLNFNNLQSNYGFGFRFNTDNGVVLRIDSAFGSRDGKHFHIALGGVF